MKKIQSFNDVLVGSDASYEAIAREINYSVHAVKSWAIGRRQPLDVVLKYFQLKELNKALQAENQQLRGTIQELLDKVYQ